MPVPSSTDIQTQSEQQSTQQTQTQTQTQATTATTTATSQSQPPTSTEALPDATLDFAAKMFDLARQGDPTLLAYLSAGLPSDLTNSRGDTLLMLASYHGHSSLVSSMLDPSTLPPVQLPNQDASTDSTPRNIKPPDPNSLNARGQSIVAGAVFKGHDEVVKILIDHGADPLSGQPNAEDTAKMFHRWEDAQNLNGDGEVRKGFKELFQNAKGRGKGARMAPPAVPDREQGVRRPNNVANNQDASTTSTS